MEPDESEEGWIVDWDMEKQRVEEILRREGLPMYEISVSAEGTGAATDQGGWFVMVRPEGGLQVKPDLIELDQGASDRVRELLQENGYTVEPRPREGDGSVWVKGPSSQ